MYSAPKFLRFILLKSKIQVPSFSNFSPIRPTLNKKRDTIWTVIDVTGKDFKGPLHYFTASVGPFHLERPLKFQFTAFEGSLIPGEIPPTEAVSRGLSRGVFPATSFTVHSVYNFDFPLKHIMHWYLSHTYIRVPVSQ